MKLNIITSAILLSLSTWTFAEDTQSTTPPASTPAKQQITDNFQTDDVENSLSGDNETTKISPDKINCDLKIDAKAEVKNETVIIWSEKAAVQSFNYSDQNIDGKLKELKNCFTTQGYSGYEDALSKSGNIEAIKTQKLTVSSIVDGATKINKLEDNKWQLKVPLQVVYQNDKEKLTQLLFIDMLVARRPSGELGILQIIAAPRDKMIDKKE